MHTLVRRYIKTAIGFLAAGLLIGLWMLVRRELYGVFASSFERSAHTHALLVGFVMMMILGVALWLFPRPSREDERYDPRVAEAAYWFVTVGTGGRVIAELLHRPDSSAVLRWAIVVCGVAQVVGLLLFFATMWSRIRPVGSRAREAAGERF
jgi:heme/copper-type cytochrome/quinol oxidase subunit 1